MMMKIFAANLILIMFLNKNVVVAISCNSGITNCTNNAYFNIYSCSCECFPSYSGDYCENLLCDVLDPDVCKSFRSSQCSVGIISSYCPIFCLKCTVPTDPPIITQTTGPIVTTTSFRSTTTITTATTTLFTTAVVKSCKSTLSCLNGGIFDPLTCQCRCFPSYKGEFCEKLACVTDDSVCKTVFTQRQCTIDIVKNLCPYLCGGCKTN